MTQTGADKLRVWALSFAGLDDYQWGEVPGPYGDHDSDPRDGDCSGACYAWWRSGDVPASVLGGRNTADFYYHRGEAINSGNAVCGDYIVLRQNGYAHHIIMCIGRGDTMEAKGEAFGYVRSTVAKCMTRGGAKAMRMPKVHNSLGNLTGATGGVHRPPHPVWPGIYFHKGLRDKSHPDSISRFQERLKVRGWQIDATGVFDEHTDHVVRQFQAQKHLEVDGVVGPNTFHAIYSPV